METQNLWPDFSTEEINGPKAILKEQAGFLAEKTNFVLLADVETTQYDGKFVHNFYIIAPALNNYRYKLCSIQHEAVVQYYPLQVLWDDYDTPWENDFFKNSIENEEQFVDALRKVFTAPRTVKIISSLLSQSLEEQRA